MHCTPTVLPVSRVEKNKIEWDVAPTPRGKKTAKAANSRRMRRGAEKQIADQLLEADKARKADQALVAFMEDSVLFDEDNSAFYDPFECDPYDVFRNDSYRPYLDV